MYEIHDLQIEAYLLRIFLGKDLPGKVGKQRRYYIFKKFASECHSSGCPHLLGILRKGKIKSVKKKKR